MSSGIPPSSKDSDNGHHGLFACAGLLVLIAAMVASYHYPYPSGKRPDLLDLVMFWGREALIAVVGLALLAVYVVASGIGLIKRIFRGKPDA